MSIRRCYRITGCEIRKTAEKEEKWRIRKVKKINYKKIRQLYIRIIEREKLKKKS